MAEVRKLAVGGDDVTGDGGGLVGDVDKDGDDDRRCRGKSFAMGRG